MEFSRKKFLFLSSVIQREISAHCRLSSKNKKALPTQRVLFIFVENCQNIFDLDIKILTSILTVNVHRSGMWKIDWLARTGSNTVKLPRCDGHTTVMKGLRDDDLPTIYGSFIALICYKIVLFED